MTPIIIKVILAYLIGSISGSLLLGKFRNVDIRKSGSGNAGGTNAFRTQGLKFALAVVVIDIGKGVIAAAFIPMINWPLPVDNLAVSVQAVLCGFAAVFGHCYPAWHGFRGGKGSATAIGVICVIQPQALIPMLLTWAVVLIFTGWVGLATMMAGFSLVPAMIWLDAPSEYVWFSLVLALFLVFTHRSNVSNMMKGSEYRFKKAMLFHRGN